MYDVHSAIVLYQRTIHIQLHGVIVFCTSALYVIQLHGVGQSEGRLQFIVTSALYTFSYTVSTNQRAGCGGALPSWDSMTLARPRPAM